MNVANQNEENDSLNEENDSLKITQNEDGTFCMEWDKEDSKWSFLNDLTSKEISIIVQQAIEEELKRHGG